MSRHTVLLLAAATIASAAGCASVEEQTAEARFEQAEEWFAMTKYTEARGLYRHALDLMEGDYPEASLGLANCYRELCKIESNRYINGEIENGIDIERVKGYYREAERFFLWSLGKRPDYRDAFYGLGLLYYETAVSRTIPFQLCRTDAERMDFKWRKLTAARDRFEKAYALDIEPKSGAPQEYLAQIYNQLGIEVLRRNDIRGAVEFFEKSYAAADRYIAWVRWQLRPQTDARVFDFFETRLRMFEALKADLDKSLATLYLRLGERHARESDAGGAIECYLKVRLHCGQYLTWLKKQPVPAGDPDFKKDREQAILDMKGQADAAMTKLGRPPAKSPPEKVSNK